MSSALQQVRLAAGHVKLNRMDKRSQLNCLKECGRLLGLGCSVLFFPEGTRTKDGKMAAFKKVCMVLSCLFLPCIPADIHYISLKLCNFTAISDALQQNSGMAQPLCCIERRLRHRLAAVVAESMCKYLQGAFSIAAKAKVPVVPVTLVGTGKLMPNGKENMVYNGSVRMIVHPAVQPTKADQMLLETRNAIASRLPAEAVLPQLSTKE
jgi:1-acyl-sn-glycerol-3-phosphate acyltransferase